MLPLVINLKINSVYLSGCLDVCKMSHDIGADLDLDQHCSRSRWGVPPHYQRTTKYTISYLENASKLLKIMKYLTKITKKNFQFSCDTRISPRTAISAVFEASNQAKFSKTLHSCRRLPPATDTTPGERCNFVVVRHGSIVVVHMSRFMLWFKPLKSTKQMGGWGVGAGGGVRAQTQISIPNPFHPWPLILTHIHPLNPFTHGPKHSHTPIPTPPSPMAQTQTPTLTPFTHG